jgi:hypothetical protein
MRPHQQQNRRAAVASRRHSPSNPGDIGHRPLIERRRHFVEWKLLLDGKIMLPLGQRLDDQA